MKGSCGERFLPPRDDASLGETMGQASAEYWKQLSAPAADELQADCLALRNLLFSMQGILRWRARAAEETLRRLGFYHSNYQRSYDNVKP